MISVMKMKKNIGIRIKEYRSRAKMTQGVLAEKLGVTNRAVSNWESGTNGVDVDLIPAICAALDVSPNELLGTPTKEGLAEESISFAKAFESLDAPGKAAVQAVLESQQQRIRRYGTVDKPIGFVRGRPIPMVQGTHEAIIQMQHQSKQEQRELHQSETLQTDPT